MNFILSTLALVLAPFIYALGRRSPLARQALDGFIFITIAGIVCVNIIPEALETGGTAALVFLAVGLAFPFVIEHLGSIPHRKAHVFIVMLAGLGLVVHASIDGIALLDEALAPAIILHRVPVGMAIWWSVRPSFGTGSAIVVFATIIGATGVAYLLGAPFMELAEIRGISWFQAFVAGSLVHVVAFGISSDHGGQVEPAAGFRDWGYRAGILIGLFVLSQGLA